MTSKMEHSTYNAYSVPPAHRMVTVVSPEHHLYGKKGEIVKVGGVGRNANITIKLPDGNHSVLPLSYTDYVELLEDDPAQNEMPLICAEHLNEVIPIIAIVMQDD